MAGITVCDGTGVEIPEDAPTTGFFGKQYSDAARPVAEAYLAELNELHTAAHREFEVKLEALREKYRPQLRELPDA